ncbi:3-methylcrotonyl-CoA carboxylase alpha subunit [Acrasis kona]|uniref:3-methylcrotonyl-CoA carboxylase alpha subunit n=1 Tax=Acrasis kona TaxID=1008807 RepID=A0AAW2ZF51_9EUKA
MKRFPIARGPAICRQVKRTIPRWERVNTLRLNRCENIAPRFSTTFSNTVQHRSYSTSNESNKTLPLFDKILIANRGEIACRIINTARKLGIKTVAVYSEADAKSMHVDQADEAYLLGPPESKRSYLLGEKILEIAKRSGAQAIHPGYGFLSENASFAKKCEEQGVVFIGPPASAIVSMGSKSESKKIMIDANVPVVPGYHGEDQDPSKLHQEADRIGYPVLIKAVMGGGGKGMRIVNSSDQFQEQLTSAKRESKNSFGDDNVLVERYVAQPRHVEIQVFADTHGNCVYLFERDCSVQRRHQKIIEEAPAPGLSEQVRRNMGESACAAARAVGYVGAGTVEFIMDNSDQSYYFMEMNTRLQVEHPVTEMITGQDLVHWQLQVASGHHLPLTQNELSPNGHSFEARIYAEDPDNNFLPGTGTLHYLQAPPAVSGQVRVETGVRQGDQVSIYYDPMIAKLVVWASDRDQALAKLKINLDNYRIAGLNTNIEFLKRLCTNQHFRNAELDTHFINTYHDELFPKQEHSDLQFVLGTAVLITLNQDSNVSDAFAQQNRFRMGHELKQSIHFDQDHSTRVTFKSNGDYVVEVNGVEYQVKVIHDPHESNTRTIYVNDEKHKVTNYLGADHILHLFTQRGDHFKCKLNVPSMAQTNEAAGGSLKSPMPGAIIAVNVKQGDVVKKGQTLIVMESMKMELKIASPSDGVVASVYCKQGDAVSGDQVLVLVNDE